MTLMMGIDPGVTGALAVVYYRSTTVFEVIQLVDLPVVNEVNGRVIDVLVLQSVLWTHAPDMVVIEYPMWTRHDGGAQASTSWRNFGRIEATVAISCDALLHLVSPADWKKGMGLTLGKLADRKQKKAHALDVARKLFGTDPHLKRVKDHDRGEALLLTYWGFSQMAS